MGLTVVKTNFGLSNRDSFIHSFFQCILPHCIIQEWESGNDIHSRYLYTLLSSELFFTERPGFWCSYVETGTVVVLWNYAYFLSCYTFKTCLDFNFLNRACFVLKLHVLFCTDWLVDSIWGFGKGCRMTTPVYLHLFLFLRIGVPSVVICYRASYYCASKSESIFNRWLPVSTC
jgi:hypothetical protein